MMDQQGLGLILLLLGSGVMLVGFALLFLKLS